MRIQSVLRLFLLLSVSASNCLASIIDPNIWAAFEQHELIAVVAVLAVPEGETIEEVQDRAMILLYSGGESQGVVQGLIEMPHQPVLAFKGDETAIEQMIKNPVRAAVA